MADWMEYALLAAQLDTQSQVSHLRADVARLEAESSKHLALVHHDLATQAQREEAIAALRQYVFARAEEIRAMWEYVDQQPMQVYVVVGLIAHRFAADNVTPALFPQFSDKEYVRRVGEDIKNVLLQAESRLPPDQLVQANACRKAIVEMPLLDEMIEVQKAYQSVKALEAVLGAAAAARQRWRRLGLTVVGIGTSTVCDLADLLSSIGGMGYWRHPPERALWPGAKVLAAERSL